MKRTLKINIKEILYFLGYFLMGLSNVVIGNSYLFGINRFLICELVQYIAAVMFLLSFCIGKYKLIDIITVILLGIVTLLSAKFMHSITFGLFALAFVTSIHIDVRKIINISVINNGIFLLMVIVPALMGWIPNDIYYRNGAKAYSLGFAYYSNVPYIILMCTIIIYWLIESKTLEKVFLLLSIPIHLCVYKISTVRLVFYVYILFLVFVIVFRRINTKKQHKILTWIATLMYPVSAAFIFFATFTYNSSPALSAFNEAINYRLSFNLQGFVQYGVKLFGQKINTSAEYIDANFIKHYFFIDCGYVYILLAYGLIFFVVIMLLYILISRYAMKNNDIKLVCWCFVVCVFSLINNIMFNLSLNPLPILGLNLFLSGDVRLSKRKKETELTGIIRDRKRKRITFRIK